MTVDTRFYASLGALTLRAAAELTGSELAGDPELEITGISAADQAKPGELAFLDGDGSARMALSSGLNVAVTNEAARAALPAGVSCLISRLPRFAHSLIASKLFKPIHLLAVEPIGIALSARVHPGALISHGAIIGPGAAVGDGTVVGPNAVIGPGVQIGRNAKIGAGVSVYCALLGDNVTVLAGARIGEAGFGVMAGPAGQEDAPHFGRVIVQDHATIGANTCIDRGVFGDTIIGERTKIDNLCQIAHNVVLGRSVVIAAFGGISGSVRIGDGSVLGGRVGIADHVTVGENVRLAGSAGVFRDVTPNETLAGMPAKPIRQWLREVAWVAKQASARKRD